MSVSVRVFHQRLVGFRRKKWEFGLLACRFRGPSTSEAFDPFYYWIKLVVNLKEKFLGHFFLSNITPNLYKDEIEQCVFSEMVRGTDALKVAKYTYILMKIFDLYFVCFSMCWTQNTRKNIVLRHVNGFKECCHLNPELNSISSFVIWKLKFSRLWYILYVNLDYDAM
jgi:hypothetical protein